MKQKLFAILFSAVALCACSSDGFNADEPCSGAIEINHGMIVLGSQLEDPYSVTNMTKAFQSLYPAKAAEAHVNTTHLYVRFLPGGEDQFDELEALGVSLLDHPVDFEILREGDYYHDPEIPEDDITWQYAVVPPDFDFPSGIKYELLHKCHITEQAPTTRSGGNASKDDDIDWAAVERESFRLTGNKACLLETKGEAVIPEGRLTIVDDKYGSKPFGIAGVRVSCNVFVKFDHTFTDEDGYYHMNKSFSLNPRYRLVFQNKYGFAQGFNLVLCPASFSTLGRHGPEGFSATVTQESDRALFMRCVVNNAGWDYYKQCKTEDGSLSTPPHNLRIWNFNLFASSSAVMLQQGVLIDDTVIRDYLGQFAWLVKWFLPDITLGLKDKMDYASIYSEAMHEFAHASHFMQAGKDYWGKLARYILKSYITSGFITYGVGSEEDHGYCEVAEMWAYYMQTRLYNARYPEDKRIYGTVYWFYPQIFNYLDDRGLNYYKVFNALLPTVKSREELQDKLIQLYPEAKSMILLAFYRYR